MWRSFKTILRTASKSAQKSRTAFQNYYTGPEMPLSEIEDHFVQFEGGSFDLQMDESSGIATLCINHYEKRNALGGKMMVDLSKSVAKLEAWESGKGVLLYGANHTFCSGGDLDFARKTSNPHGGFQMASFMHNVLSRFEKLPFITIAVIEGSGALGGGAELAVACDFRLIAEDAKGIGFMHSRMGIAPAWGGATRLVNLVGYQKALNLMLTARLVDAQEALRIGLIDDIISSEDPLSAAKEWLKLHIKQPSEIVQAIKSMANNGRQLNYEESLSEERRIFAPLWGGPTNQQALTQNIKHKI